MEARTTVTTRIASALADLQSQAAATAKWQLQISSGKKLAKPSDNPSDFTTVIDYKARDLRFDSFKATIGDATEALNEGVSHLNEAQQVLTRAHELASEAANGTSDAPAYAAVATEIDALLERFVNLANSKVGDRYLFGGTATTTQPFEVTATNPNGLPTVITYRGADERSKAIIGQGQTVDAIYAGNRIFQGPPDGFQALMDIRDALRNPALTQTALSTALNQHMASLEGSRAVLLNSMGEQSSSLENMEALVNRIGDVQLSVKSRVGDLEGADFAEASVRFQEQQNAFQATLLVTNRIFEVSMLDFVR